MITLDPKEAGLALCKPNEFVWFWLPRESGDKFHWTYHYIIDPPKHYESYGEEMMTAIADFLQDGFKICEDTVPDKRLVRAYLYHLGKDAPFIPYLLGLPEDKGRWPNRVVLVAERYTFTCPLCGHEEPVIITVNWYMQLMTCESCGNEFRASQLLHTVDVRVGRPIV